MSFRFVLVKVRALNALANPGDVAARNAAAFEFECSNATAAKLGKTSRGILIPFEVQKGSPVRVEVVGRSS